MEYTLTHEATIEANSPDDAKRAYRELWQTGFYQEQDVDIVDESEETE